MFLFYCICSWFCFPYLTEDTYCTFWIQFYPPHCLCSLWVHFPHSSAFSYCLMILCSHLRLGHKKSNCKPCVVGLFAVGFTAIDLIDSPDSCRGSPNVSIYKSSLLGRSFQHRGILPSPLLVVVVGVGGVWLKPWLPVHWELNLGR